MNIDIQTWVRDDCTLGRLSVGNFRCFTLELPWLDNTTNISCIPAGTYSARKYQSPKHGEVILIEGVPGRSMIEIHAGNFTRQILGCLLAGDSIKYLDGDSVPDVTNSKSTVRKLLALLPDEFTVTIGRV